MLQSEFGERVGFSVSHTTRAPRKGEIDGKHYHFTTKEKFMKLVGEGKFIEYANVHGNMYGTSRDSVEAVINQGKVAILDIDVQGAKNVVASAADLDAYMVFVKPPSMAELERRLRNRGTETEASIQKRLGNASGELEDAKLLFWHTRLENGNLDKTYATLRSLVGRECMAGNEE